MRNIFQAFKKHYYKASDVHKKLAQAGDFSLTSRTTPDSMEAKLNIPDEELMVRFVVLMRRFLSPTDRLYYHTVWATLKEQFAQELPESIVDQVDAFITEWNKGEMPISYNHEQLTAQEIYTRLAEGQYFDQKEGARAFIQELANMNIPLAGVFMWHQFYDYTSGGFVLASKLFDLIKVVEGTPRYKALYGDPADIVNRCIYCLTTTGKFTSEEHVLPEALGNYDEVLPPGHVCDNCNNGVLSQLDNELSQSPLFAFQRVDAVPYTKQGKLPQAHFEGATLIKTGPLNVTLRADPGSDAIKVTREREDGWVEFDVNLKSDRPFDERTLARALCKIGLGLVALDSGQEYACSNRYDAVRAFILEGRDFANNLLIRSEFTRHLEIKVQYHTLPKGTPMSFDIFGVSLLINLEEQPKLDLNEQLRQAGVMSFPLHGASTWQNFNMRMVNPNQNRATSGVPKGVE